MKSLSLSISTLVLIVLGFASLRLALAHDPGLSIAELTLSDHELEAHIVFARRDIEPLVQIDSNQDAVMADVEFRDAMLQLRTLAGRILEIISDSNQFEKPRVDIDLDASDGVHFYMRFTRPHGATFSASVPIIDQLARGHRQYLTVRGQAANLVAERILSAGSTSVVIQTESLNLFYTFKDYLVEGIWHIWIGLDHLLFLLSLLLPAVFVRRQRAWVSVDRIRPALADILKIVTAFSIAHSITLTLAVLDILVFPLGLAESLIALSVVIAAINNLYPIITTARWGVAFGFGLIHGLGFANVVDALSLPANALAISLFGFNAGVEIGQVAIVCGVLPLAYWARRTRLYRHWIFNGGSAVVALVGSVWIFERVFDYSVLGF